MRFRYFLNKALLSLKKSPGITMLTSLTIALTLLVVGSYVLILQNLEQTSLLWGRTASITAYLHDELRQSDWTLIRDQIENLDGVQTATLITPQQALDTFIERGPQAAQLVEGINSEILPASIALKLDGSFVSLAKTEQIAQIIQEYPTIQSVDYGREEFLQLQKFITVLRYAGILAGCFLALATVLIISNTIRLTIYARRDEIVILQLVGATSNFVRAPFLIEGCIWGLAAGGLSWLLFWLAQLTLVPHLLVWGSQVLGGASFHLYDPLLCFSLLVIGFFLGGIGSTLAVNRFLRAGN